MAKGVRKRIVEPDLNSSVRSKSSAKPKRSTSPGRKAVKESKAQSPGITANTQDSGHGSLVSSDDFSMSLLGTPQKLGTPSKRTNQQAFDVLHSTPTKQSSSTQHDLQRIRDTPDHLYGLDVDSDLQKEFTTSILSIDGNQSIITQDMKKNEEPKKQNVSSRGTFRAVLSGITTPWTSSPKLFWIVTLSVVIIIGAIVFHAFLKKQSDELPCSVETEEVDDTPQTQARLINELKEQIKHLSSLVSGMSEGIVSNMSSKKAAISKEELTKTLEEYMDAYDADKVGLPDFALEASGGRIHKPHLSPTNTNGAAKVSMFGVPVFIDSKDPSVILQPDNTPGNCWPMKGQKGFVVIQLAQSIIPYSFTLEHIPKSLSLTGDDTIPSAPKEFSVFGWHDSLGEKKTFLGKYTYDSEKKPLQKFQVDLPQEKNTVPFLYVELRIHSNYGEPQYTCIYRFRVHGQPKDLTHAPRENDELEVNVAEAKDNEYQD